jgi:hypothetical protein
VIALSPTGRWGGKATARPLPDAQDELAALDPALREALAEIWWVQSATEFRVAASFEVVHASLVGLDADAALVALAARAVDDEHRHAALCLDMAGRLAGRAVECSARVAHAVPPPPRGPRRRRAPAPSSTSPTSSASLASTSSCAAATRRRSTRAHWLTVAPLAPVGLILVSAINPTPAGEGKTTTSIGLAMGMRRLGKKVVLCLREPSLGPVFGVKGGGTGGGQASARARRTTSTCTSRATSTPSPRPQPARGPDRQRPALRGHLRPGGLDPRGHVWGAPST